MDLYRGQYDFTTFSTQVHDFDPGIDPYPGGLFWTVPNPTLGPIELGTGRASMSMANLALQDYFDIPNALFRFEVPVSTDASCSFNVKWTGPVTGSGPVNTPGSTGELITTSAFAQLGRVQNGVFAD
ncbi:MAG: hypothetical protein E6I39_02215 [Chloroflexi bacterium]|nr:MAG: hypothetical protein E6I39_02215 [Chloroflexota bacterium]